MKCIALSLVAPRLTSLVVCLLGVSLSSVSFASSEPPTVTSSSPSPAPALDVKDLEDKAPELAAIQAELKRGLQNLRLEDNPSPYYARVRLVRGEVYTFDGSYGGTLSDLHNRVSLGEVEVRVGSRDLDNSGYLVPTGTSRFDLPVEPTATITRHSLWLAMDRAFREATASFSDKETTLTQLAQEQQPPSWSTPPSHHISFDWQRDPSLPSDLIAPKTHFEPAAFRELSRSLSERFRNHPQIDNGDVIIQIMAIREVSISSDSIVIGKTVHRGVLAVVADTRAADGMHLDHGKAIHFQVPPTIDAGFRNQAETLVDSVLNELRQMSEAPRFDEDYDGPVLFSPVASAQLLASTVATQSSGTPAPMGDDGPMTRLEPHWQDRLGKSVLPDALELIDDPTADGFGNYAFDVDGVKAKSVRLVDKGVLSELLMTRAPNDHISDSNGHDRMSPSGNHGSAISNLTLSSHSGAMANDKLQDELLRRAKDDGYDFAYIVEELRDGNLLGPVPRDTAAIFASARKVGVPLPSRVYRVDTNGTRTLVRGAILSPASMRVLRRIRAWGRDPKTTQLRIVPGPYGGFAADVGSESLLFETVDAQVTTPSLVIDGFELIEERGEHERLPYLVHPLRRTSKEGRPPATSPK